MISMTTAYTEEVDEIEDGIAEILGQIDLKLLKKNSIGLISCHPDFVNEKFLSELCNKLPFDVIGMTTMASANKYGQSMYSLSLTVLSSDDVLFDSVLSETLDDGNYNEKMNAVFTASTDKQNEKPSMIISFFPFINNVGGALLHKSFDAICGGIPFWGSLASNPKADWDTFSIFRNSEINMNAAALVLLYGPVEPEFIIVSLPPQNIRKNRGIITASEGCVLKEINGMPPLEYLESFGIIIMKDSPVVTPLMVYYEGNTDPVATGIYSVNDDGSLFCGNEMTKGASLAIGEITSGGIIATANEAMSRVMASGKRNGVMFLPCITRYIMLTPNHTDEISIVVNKMENGTIMPFHLAYSGGEICPVKDNNGVLRNQFHNYTFIACIF